MGLDEHFQNLRNAVTATSNEYGDEEAGEVRHLLSFDERHLISLGMYGTDDSQTVVKTYIIKKKEYNYSIRELLKSVPKQVIPELGHSVSIFKRFSIGIPIYSDYDCTGALCGLSRSSTFVDQDYKWIIIVETNYSYDL
jgi:hypothetical protein